MLYSSLVSYLFYIQQCVYWRRKWQPPPVFLPRESQGQRSLVGCRLWGRTELGTTEATQHACMHACIGEGNGNPLQYSCLENPRDRGAWWASVYGVTQSRTRLMRLSSSSSSSVYDWIQNHRDVATLLNITRNTISFFLMPPGQCPGTSPPSAKPNQKPVEKEAWVVQLIVIRLPEPKQCSGRKGDSICE